MIEWQRSEIAQVCADVSGECQFDIFSSQTVSFCKVYSPYKYPSKCLSENAHQAQRGNICKLQYKINILSRLLPLLEHNVARVFNPEGLAHKYIYFFLLVKDSMNISHNTMQH